MQDTSTMIPGQPRPIPGKPTLDRGSLARLEKRVNEINKPWAKVDPRRLRRRKTKQTAA